jgi:putative sigma-54 modulation protein
MKYNVVGKDYPVSKKILDHVEKKFSVLDKYFIIKDTTECRVLIKSISNGSFKFEVNIPTKYAFLRAEVTNFSVLDAIDLTVEKIEDQLRKAKTKMNRSKGKEKFGKVISIEQISNIVENEIAVKTKRISPELIDLDGAIAQMELLGHTFYIYKDVEDGKIAVVYKRFTGGYGLIEIE